MQHNQQSNIPNNSAAIRHALCQFPDPQKESAGPGWLSPNPHPAIAAHQPVLSLLQQQLLDKQQAIGAAAACSSQHHFRRQEQFENTYIVTSVSEAYHSSPGITALCEPTPAAAFTCGA
jgi:hypothetical protein